MFLASSQRRPSRPTSRKFDSMSNMMISMNDELAAILTGPKTGAVVGHNVPLPSSNPNATPNSENVPPFDTPDSTTALVFKDLPRLASRITITDNVKGLIQARASALTASLNSSGVTTQLPKATLSTKPTPQIQGLKQPWMETALCSVLLQMMRKLSPPAQVTSFESSVAAYWATRNAEQTSVDDNDARYILSHSIGLDSHVTTLLRAINQAVVLCASFHLTTHVLGWTNLRTKDIRTPDGWKIDIRMEYAKNSQANTDLPIRVNICHVRKEQSLDSSSAKRFDFEWELHLMFDLSDEEEDDTFVDAKTDPLEPLQVAGTLSASTKKYIFSGSLLKIIALNLAKQMDKKMADGLRKEFDVAMAFLNSYSASYLDANGRPIPIQRTVRTTRRSREKLTTSKSTSSSYSNGQCSVM